jgi:phytoene/squalene synthetase
MDQSPSADIVRTSDHDRWLCALFAEPEKREAIFSILAFNTEIARIRETVSEPILGDIRLKWWDEALDKIGTGDTPRHPVVEPLRNSIEKYNLSLSMFREILLGRSQDLSDTPPTTWDDLVAYAEKTGGALHSLISGVLGTDAEKGKSVGTCWALMGVLRAIPFHYQHGLVLLPQELLDRGGLTTQNFTRPENKTQFISLIKDITRQIDSRLLLLEDAPPTHYSERSVIILNRMYLNNLQQRKHDLHGGDWNIPGWKRSLRLWAGSVVNR